MVSIQDIKISELMNSIYDLFRRFQEDILKHDPVEKEYAEMKKEKELNKVTGEFREDVNALIAKFGVLKSGMKYQLELHEALTMMPRPKRPRTDAYKRLQKYLQENFDCILTIKSGRTRK